LLQGRYLEAIEIDTKESKSSSKIMSNEGQESSIFSNQIRCMPPERWITLVSASMSQQPRMNVVMLNTTIGLRNTDAAITYPVGNNPRMTFSSVETCRRITHPEGKSRNIQAIDTDVI